MPTRGFDAGRTTNSSNLERPMNLHLHKPNRIELILCSSSPNPDSITRTARS
jgi:hypothetical protein